MEKTEQIKKLIKDLLGFLQVPFDDVLCIEEEGTSWRSFVIKTPHSGILIGTKGVTISALNHLVKKIAGKRSDEDSEEINFYVDVNDYHRRLIEEVKNKATILAERARSFKTSVEMEPMSSYERMVIHALFENVRDIKTESRGEGPKRHIVLVYSEKDEL